MNQKTTDHTFFLKVLSKVYKVFNVTNRVKLNIPHTIFLEQSKIWYWLFSKKGMLKNLSENYLKIELVFTYFCVKEVRNLSFTDLPNYDMMLQFKNQEKIDYRFLIRLQPKKGIFYFFTANREMIDLILNSEQASKLDAIYTSNFKEDSLLFYKILVKRNKDKTVVTIIQRLGAKAKRMTPEDWLEYNSQGLFHENGPVEVTYFTRSINQKNNERLDRLCKELMKYFEYKTYLKVQEMTFYMMINKEEVISLLETENIKFVDSTGVKYISDINTNTFELRENFTGVEIREPKCEGLYCNYRDIFENAMIDEKDELNNLYIMESDIDKKFKIEYKSIILDLVERLKTIERVQNATDFSREKVDKLADGLMFLFRKYYSIADLKKFELFRHIHYIHLYHKKNVCAFCFAMYNKIDNLRLNSNNAENNYLKKKVGFENIQSKIKDYGIVEKELNAKEKILFSDKFYEMIKQFDEPPPEEILYEVDPALLDNNEKRLIKEVKHRRKQRSKQKDEEEDEEEKSEIDKKNKITQKILKENALRLHLGTREKQKSYHSGSITTSTSLKLSSLSSKIKKLENIAKKNRGGNLGMSEDQFVELIMCPYLGKGKVDHSTLKEYREEEEKFKKDHHIVERKLELQFNLALDKGKKVNKSTLIKKKGASTANYFRKTKKQLEEEKEMHRQEMQELRERHSSLAKSVLKSGSASNARIDDETGRSTKSGKFNGFSKFAGKKMPYYGVNINHS